MGGPWSVTGTLSSLGIGSAGVGCFSAVSASAGTFELLGIVISGVIVARSVVVL